MARGLDTRMRAYAAMSCVFLVPCPDLNSEDCLCRSWRNWVDGTEFKDTVSMDCLVWPVQDKRF